MRQNVADVASLTVIVDNYDKAVLVYGDIEYNELTHLICHTD
jgi:hypothetical protein